jgi:2-succinyl-6-hydroxy-2,4-cyclohexadiene-1-carboxylate synthase
MDDLPIVLLHGFTQTGASWAPVREHLPAAWDVRTPDLPGHGTAGAVRADLIGTASRLAAELDRPAVVVGYSMGGRVALRLALDHPDRVAGLGLLGATAGIDDPHDRAVRRRADHELADRIEADGVAAFLDGWLAQPLFAGLELTSDDRAARLANPASGLAASLRLAGTATMDPPWWAELREIRCPTLVAWGEHDAKFAALGRRLADAIGPVATTAAVAGCGHAAHLESSAAFAHLVEDLAARARAAPPGPR